jgi:hypothetical protein
MVMFVLSSECRIPCRIFCSTDLVDIYCFSYCLLWKLLSLHQFWMFSFDAQNTSSYAFLLLRFLLRNVLVFWWEYLYILFVFFLPCTFQYSFLVLCAICFWLYAMERFYFGQVCLVSWRLPVHEWTTLSQDLGNFPLLFCWICCVPLCLPPLVL